MTLQIVSLEDGSITCLDETTGELYHNRAGAFKEALSTYIEPLNLADLINKQSKLSVVDSCFGLGYNTFALIQEILLLLDSQPNGKMDFVLEIIALDKDVNILPLLSRVLKQKCFERLYESLTYGDDY